MILKIHCMKLKHNLENTQQQLTQFIKNRADSLGFFSCGISAVRELDEHKNTLDSWLENGYSAEMNYMQRNKEMRINPALLVEGSKSIISLTCNYFPKEQQSPENYQIAKYAYGEDYHKILKKKLHTLLKEIQNINNNIKGRAFVDSAPILERTWAVESGLGWVGKNSLLIVPKQGSYFFLCELILNIELEYDRPFTKNYCGTCTKCISACPAKAINSGANIDSRKCISYLTIEKKDTINNHELAKSPYIFGCDVCQDVCPWNRFSKPQDEFVMNKTLRDLSKVDFETITLEKFEELTIKSPLKRIRYEKFLNTIMMSSLKQKNNT